LGPPGVGEKVWLRLKKRSQGLSSNRGGAKMLGPGSETGLEATSLGGAIEGGGGTKGGKCSRERWCEKNKLQVKVMSKKEGIVTHMGGPGNGGDRKKK